MSISSMTELEAVNLMLTNIGEAPVNTIEGTNMLDIAIAKQVLREVLIEVQEPGWDFNTESGITITPNEDGEIWFPINALRVDPVDRSLKVVMRGHRLYDKENHTYEFSGPVDVEIVFGLEFEQCPQALRQYVAIKAARIYQRRMVGSDLLEKLTQADEYNALVKLQNFDTDTADYNMLTGSADVMRIIAR